MDMAKPNFSIRVEGLSDALKSLEKLKQKSEQGTKNILQETALNVLRKSQENLASTPFYESVGGIAQSGYIENSTDGYSFEVGFNKHYSPYIEYGTGTKVDVPNGFEQYALQFIGAGIREVNIKPHPYFHPALNDELKNLKRKLNDLLKVN